MARARRARRPLTLLAAAAGVGVLGLLAAGSFAGSGGRPTSAAAAPRQEESTTTSRPAILVPGPTVDTSTTAVATTTTSEARSGMFEGLRQDFREMVADETGRTVAIAIGGLLLVALVLAVLTIRYWRKTRPVKRPKG